MKRGAQFDRSGIRGTIAQILCTTVSLTLIPQQPLQASTQTATQSLSASLSPIGELSVPSSLTLANTGTIFNNYLATLSVSYKVRTTPGGTGGTITMQASADFSPTGGPSISSGNLTYTCSGSTLGTGCSGTQTVSTSSATPVLTIPTSSCTGGGGSCSGSNPNTVSLNLTLADQIAYSTGSYSTSVTFTISAT